MSATTEQPNENTLPLGLLPLGLPLLPPVPEGYDRWEWKGLGGLEGPQGAAWATAKAAGPFWEVFREHWSAGGHMDQYYILAVKDPAPALDALPDANEIGDCALASQVGGDHYKRYAIQPVEFITKNKLGFCEGNAIKYLCRHGDKNGAQDLRKAIHYIELLLQMEYPNK